MDVSAIVKRLAPKTATIILVVVAAVAAYVLYRRWVEKPWTRDGQVRADIVKIAPRVMGYIATVAVEDNQFVRKGDLLFEIDPSSFELAVEETKVELDQAREDVASLAAAVRASRAMVAEADAGVATAGGQVVAAELAVKSAKADVTQREAGIVAARALIRQRKAELDEARKEADRAQRLLEQKAASVENAERKAAAAAAKKAQLDSAEAGLSEAEAQLAQTIAGRLETSQAELSIARDSLTQAQAALGTARANLDKATEQLGEPGEANVRIRGAKVQLAQAQLKLSWTSIYAPSDGYTTNLEVEEGMFAFPGIPFAAFVDSSSFRVDGYFQETKLRHIKPGDAAVITLMGHPDRPVAGVVESIGYAVNPPDVAATEGPMDLVPQIQPTFDWVRLPQRVPVRIRLKNVPEDIQLISGTTASVAIRPNRGE